MMNADTKQTIEHFLKSMGISFDSVEEQTPEGAKQSRFLIKTKESALLIGTGGEVLSSLNFILRRIVAKQMQSETPAPFHIDVNGYQEKNIELLKNKARVMCDRARSFKVEVPLEPMSSYERMLVHSFLEGEKDIKTESRGEGRERHIVIKYSPPLHVPEI